MPTPAAAVLLLLLSAGADGGIVLEPATPESLLEIRAGRGRTTLLNFWATWCAPCRREFPELVALARAYRSEPFDLITVSLNYPDEERSVRAFLRKHGAATRNLLNAGSDPDPLPRIFHPDWNGAVPFTVILGPAGELLYTQTGLLDEKARGVIQVSVSGAVRPAEIAGAGSPGSRGPR